VHQRALSLVFAAMMACAAMPNASAQTYPSQPIRIIVPTPPGGVADIVGRAFAQKLNEAGKTAVVENKTGAGGAIAADFVAKSPPDGYTIYVGFHATNAILPHLQKLNYNPETDLVPITIAAKTANVLVVNPSVPAKTMKELIAYAKANPGKLTFASAGVGAASHLAAERFRLAAGFDGLHVPFRGPAEALGEVLAGRVDFYFLPLAAALPMLRDGKLMALAVSTPKRSPALPDVPTTTEAGLKDSSYLFWTAMFAPAKTPKPILERLHEESRKALETAVVKERLTKLAVEPFSMTQPEFEKFFRDDLAATVKLVKDAGVPRVN
jgi:tripartite-type tricarboxylate transporter receptor subunit TctC